MEACEDGEDVIIANPDVGDGASVTVELAGFRREQGEVKSSQQSAVGETMQKGFAIRQLPFLIAEKNHQRGTEKEVATDGSFKQQHGVESGRDGEGTEKGFAVRELAVLITQKHYQGAGFHGGRKQLGFESSKSANDCGDVGKTTENRLAFLVSEKKTRCSHINGDGKQHSFEPQGNRDVEVGEFAGRQQLRIEGVAASPASTVEGDEGGLVVFPSQSEITVIREDLVGDDETRKENPSTTEEVDSDGRIYIGERSEREELQIAAAEKEHHVMATRMPEIEGGSAGGVIDVDDPTRLKFVAAAADDSSNSGGLKSEEKKIGGIYNVPAHFPFKILSSLQRRAGGELGETSHPIFLPQPIDVREPGKDGKTRPLANGGNKNVEEDVERTTPRHPRWTREETSVLLAGKRKRDEEIKSLVGSKIASSSAMRRWDSISAYCKSHGVMRDVHQCRKRWSNLAADFKKIRNWQKQSGGGAGGAESYWAMKGDSRRKNKLPGSFDPQMFADMDVTSDFNPHKKRKLPSSEDGPPPDDSHRGSAAGRDPLASVVESSGKALQSALVRSIQAQIEASNQNSELDRNQRKEQSDNLVGVLSMLAESLAKIAHRL